MMMMRRFSMNCLLRRGSSGTSDVPIRSQTNRSATTAIATRRPMVSVAANPSCRWTMGSRRLASNSTTTSESSSSSSTSPNESMPWWKEYRHNGTPELLIGSALLVWFLADWWIIQPLQEQQQERLYQQVFADWSNNKNMEEEEASIQTTRSEWQSWSQPPLYRAKIVRLLPNFDGPLTLHHVVGSHTGRIQVGEEVDVLEEHVGPGGSYTLCRTVNNAVVVNGKAATVVGWYPTHALQKA